MFTCCLIWPFFSSCITCFYQSLDSNILYFNALLICISVTINFVPLFTFFFNNILFSCSLVCFCQAHFIFALIFVIFNFNVISSLNSLPFHYIYFCFLAISSLNSYIFVCYAWSQKQQLYSFCKFIREVFGLNVHVFHGIPGWIVSLQNLCSFIRWIFGNRVFAYISW